MSNTAAMEMQQETQVSGSAVRTEIVVCLGQWYTDSSVEHLQPLLAVLREAFRERAASTLIAYPVSDPQAESWHSDGFTLQPYQSTAGPSTLQVAVASSYLDLYEVMRAHGSECGVLLGAEAQSLHAGAICGLVDAVLDRKADLALPRYSVRPNDGLINAAILHPLTRAIFGVRADFPLALDLALSARAAEKLAAAAQRFTAAGQPDALLWPSAEAAVNGFTIAEVTTGSRDIPLPAGSDLSTILTQLSSSLFTEVETKATYWQRTRPAASVVVVGGSPEESLAADPVEPDEISELVEAFRLGHGNLHEIWAMVLPPQTLLGIKRLSQMPAQSFAMADTLWVRIVYDFVLAHRMRTINRGHLLGALTPLYLAWVASHILAGQTNASGNPPEALAKAFEADKPYLVSRWRWPDRFNP